MLILKVLLFPLAVLYDLLMRIRNHLYAIGQKRSFRFETMVISVGNLAAGGAGKTPMVEYLIRLLKQDRHLATLSRGYGRRTRGIRFTGAADAAVTVGDEPFQLYLKFGSEVAVTVGEERAVAIPEILHAYPETDVILLDDAFQHRSVVPQLSILLTDYHAPFYTDYVLPAGRLRESRQGASRANVIVVSKCPDDFPDAEQQTVVRRIQKYSGDKPVFFTGLQYDEPVRFGQQEMKLPTDVILVSGIANAKPFEDYARSKFTVLRHFEFGDHHRFTASDLETLVAFYQAQSGNRAFLTTEKDSVRLRDATVGTEILKFPWFYIPVRVSFLKNGPEFDKIVIRSVETAKALR